MPRGPKMNLMKYAALFIQMQTLPLCMHQSWNKKILLILYAKTTNGKS